MIHSLRLRLVAAGLLLGTLAPVVHAQPAPRATAPKVEYLKKTVYEFDNDRVIGTIVRPDGDLLTGQGRRQADPLYRPRQNFIPELVLSASR